MLLTDAVINEVIKFIIILIIIIHRFSISNTINVIVTFITLSFLFQNCGLWTLSCDFVPHNSSLPILMQESFWW